MGEVFTRQVPPAPEIIMASLVSSLTAWSCSFLYQPAVGQLWDPSCFAVANGTFYCVSMYSENGDGNYLSGWLSVSPDGTQWRDVGPIAPSEPGTQWWKGFVLQRGTPPTFVLNHGVFEHGNNDALRILTSTDLLNWVDNGTSRPDGRWYTGRGRWDHMYMSEDGAGGFIGFPVSSPLDRTRFASTWPGVQRSSDGVRWTAHPPLNVTWGAMTPQSIEEGGFERLELSDRGGKAAYFLIGGGGAAHAQSSYSMWAFRADAVDGPYEPIKRRFRLSGGSAPHDPFLFGALAVWCRGVGGERLISQYMTAAGRGRADVWMLPLRKPVVDASGSLRLGYWRVNDRLLGPAVGVQPAGRVDASCSGGDFGVSWVAAPDVAAHEVGLYLNATLSGRGVGSVGLALSDVDVVTSVEAGLGGERRAREGGGEQGASYTAILVDIGVDGDSGTASRVVRVTSGAAPITLDSSGAFSCGAANLTCGVATVTAITAAEEHHALLYFRKGMWELYIDGLLVQTFVYGGAYPLPASGVGRVGVACAGGAGPSTASLLSAKIGKMAR